jgi:hypothetical protein
MFHGDPLDRKMEGGTISRNQSEKPPSRFLILFTCNNSKADTMSGSQGHHQPNTYTHHWLAGQTGLVQSCISRTGGHHLHRTNYLSNIWYVTYVLAEDINLIRRLLWFNLYKRSSPCCVSLTIKSVPYCRRTRWGCR